MSYDPADCPILVVDDDPLVLRLVRRMMRPLGHPVTTASSGEEALQIMNDSRFGLLLSDLRMDGIDGARLLKITRQRFPGLPVLIMTSHGTIETAVGLMRDGATDFITKPIDADRLAHAIARVMRTAELHDEVVDLRRKLAVADRPRDLVGESPVFRAMLDRLPLAARSDAPVLVLGETGTGKELVARGLHARSNRSAAPFVPVNCGALPGELLDSELFGHVKGAFTDAKRDKAGLVRDADGGTLFLDEIGDMPLPLQVKLLRFLQEGEIRPVGADKAIAVDVRIVAATHRDVRAMVAEGTFREDLYYRLNVIPVHVPPLRDRPGDVSLIAAHLLARHAGRTTRPDLRFGQAALARLVAHRWPGNVRELENVVRRAAIFGASAPDGVIGPEFVEFDDGPSASPAAGPTGAAVTVDLDVPIRAGKDALVDAYQRAYCEAAMTAAHGVIARAARRAGKDRKSFWELLQRYDIDPDRFRPE